MFPANAAIAERLDGTLVIAVPVAEGLVVCADKRLYNIDTGAFEDDNVKIRKAGDKALFTATNVVGFYDRKSRKIAFDAFAVTENYLAKHPFANDKKFWDGLKQEIRERLVTYLSGQPYESWPETDRANRGLLFNLIFYSAADNRAQSHSLRVFYEKKRTPVITILDPVSETVRFPKLSGKGRDVMAYLARNSSAAAPEVLKFDESVFNLQATTARDAVAFAKRLFPLTSTNVPQARVSPTFDCAMIQYQNGFQWLRPSDDRARP